MAIREPGDVIDGLDGWATRPFATTRASRFRDQRCLRMMFYSDRRASVGSTEAPRRAGRNAATAAEPDLGDPRGQHEVQLNVFAGSQICAELIMVEYTPE